MKKVSVNKFAVTGFVATDAEIHQFATASVARFPLAIIHTDKEGNRTSALMNIEMWRKKENASFGILKKNTLVTVEGYFAPKEWTDENGTRRNRVVLRATKVYETPDQDVEEPRKRVTTKKKAKK